MILCRVSQLLMQKSSYLYWGGLCMSRLSALGRRLLLATPPVLQCTSSCGVVKILICLSSVPSPCGYLRWGRWEAVACDMNKLSLFCLPSPYSLLCNEPDFNLPQPCRNTPADYLRWGGWWMCCYSTCIASMIFGPSSWST